jgi:hypothetical protein
MDRRLLEKLKTTPDKMAEVNYRKNLVGSARWRQGIWRKRMLNWGDKTGLQ